MAQQIRGQIGNQIRNQIGQKNSVNGKNGQPAFAQITDFRYNMAMSTYQLTHSIALIGLMGAGKSAVGRQLAQIIGCGFMDADTEIETEAGLSIPEIFELGGEAKFRDIEQRVIARLLDSPPMILSTGGGAFCQPETQALIQAHATSLWLYAPPETLLGRMSNPANRPLLRVADPLQVMRDLNEKRAPFYQQAKIKVDTDHCSLPQAVERVKRALIAHGVLAQDDGQEDSQDDGSAATLPLDTGAA